MRSQIAREASYLENEFVKEKNKWVSYPVGCINRRNMDVSMLSTHFTKVNVTHKYKYKNYAWCNFQR